MRSLYPPSSFEPAKRYRGRPQWLSQWLKLYQESARETEQLGRSESLHSPQIARPESLSDYND